MVRGCMVRAWCAHGVHMHCMHCICYAAAMLCSHAHLGLVPALALTPPLILTLAHPQPNSLP